MALSADQLAKVEHAVNTADPSRYAFAWADATHSDRKLAVVCVYANNGELHTAVVSASNAPNWLSNADQFNEVVAAAVAKLKALL